MRRHPSLTLCSGRGVAIIGWLALMPAVVMARPATATDRPGPTMASPQRPERRDADRRGNSPRDAELDHQVADAMQQLMVARLAQHLELSQAQQARVIPMIRELTLLRREHAARRRQAIRALATLSRDAGTEDEVIRARLTALAVVELDFRREEDSSLAAIHKHLDVRQQARLLAFEEGFRDEMRRRVEDARRRDVNRRRGGPTRPRHPAADRRPGKQPPGTRFR